MLRCPFSESCLHCGPMGAPSSLKTVLEMCAIASLPNHHALSATRSACPVYYIDVFLGGTVCRGFSFGPLGGRGCIGMCAPDLLPGRAALCAVCLSAGCCPEPDCTPHPLTAPSQGSRPLPLASASLTDEVLALSVPWHCETSPSMLVTPAPPDLTPCARADGEAPDFVS